MDNYQLDEKQIYEVDQWLQNKKYGNQSSQAFHTNKVGKYTLDNIFMDGKKGPLNSSFKRAKWKSKSKRSSQEK